MITMPSTKNVEQRTTTLLPVGKYKVYVDDVSMEQGPKASYLKWVLKTFDEPKDTDKRTLYNNTFLSEKGFWTTLKFLDSIGYEYPVGVSNWQLNPEDVLDKECIVEVEHEIYNGSPVPRVKSHYAVPTPVVLAESDLYTEVEVCAMVESELEEVIKSHKLTLNDKPLSLTDAETIEGKHVMVMDALKNAGLMA
jgi:hypothetical protein